ncbi:hypothetical protein ACFL4C_04130 [Candidatus Omnitrophota bacterium]
MNNKKQKIMALFIVTFLLEIGLRIAGGMYLKKTSLKNQSLSSAAKNAYTILCLGNSYTYGAGAGPGGSYPNHLQNMFDKKLKNRNINVINKGLLTLNSAELLQRLEGFIKQTNPDLIILRTGSPNETFSNYVGYRSYLKRENKYKSFSKKLPFALNDYLYRNIRVYRLISLLFKDLKEEPRKKSTYKNTEELYQQEGYKEANKYRKTIFLAFISRQKVNIDKQGVKQALNWFKKGVAIDSDNVLNYYALGILYRYLNEEQEAMKWYIKGIQAQPRFREGDMPNYSFVGLLLLRDNTQDKKIKKAIDEYIDKFNRTNPENSDSLLYLTNEEIQEWIESDIKEIVRIIRERQIKLIIQNYPPLIGQRQR